MRDGYAMHVFDCDGVLIDSNGVKSRAFYEAALPYGEKAAVELVAYHQRAGSIGRDARWRYFFDHILGRAPEEGELEELMAKCTRSIRRQTREAPLVAGVERYLRTLRRRRAACVVVSGIEEGELREILEERALTTFFEGAWGGPRTKGVLLRDLICTGEVARPALYYGDAEDDYLSARNNGLDFIWVRGRSEWEGLRAIRDFRELL